MEYQTETAHGTLFCRKEGSGPLLLLIHGVACDSEFFRQTSAILAEKFTVISYDRRGYSRSIPADGEDDFSVWAHAADAAELIRRELNTGKKTNMSGADTATENMQHYGIAEAENQAGSMNRNDLQNHQGVFVAGCSAGGAVAAALATRYPELVRAVFLHEPLMRGNGELAEEQDAFWEKLRKSAAKHRIITCMMHFVNAMGGMNRDKEGQTMEQQSRNLKNLEFFLEREMDSFSSLSLEDFSISAPVTVACGADDTEGMFHRSARQAAEIKGWNYMTVSGYHNFASDEPELFAEALAGVFFH